MSYKCMKTLEGHEDSVNSLCIYKNKIVSGSIDDTIKIWDISTGICQKTIEYHNYFVFHVSVLENKILSCSADHTIKINKEDSYSKLEGHKSTVHCAIILGNKVISCSNDCTIKIWSLLNSLDFILNKLFFKNSKVVIYVYNTTNENNHREKKYAN